MSITLNADTSSGLVMTSDTSGEIKLQSAGTDIATVDSSGVSATTFTPTSSTAPTNGVYLPTTNTVGISTNSTERMRVASDGKVFIGTTSYTGKVNISQSAGDWVIVEDSTFAGTQYFTSYRSSGTQIGTITGNGTNVAYNTSSDYRLKNNVAPMSGSIDRLKQLNPSTWSWTTDGSHGEGFLAHEAQTVVPEAVTGTHNEVDDDGNPVYQGIDQSKLVPLLTSALQEAITKIEDLETRIEALENA
jgi:hypothetical protein